MVDEKKTILMTKLAIFEKHEQNKSLVISKYYRSDYVRYNVLKTWVAVTILYWCLIAGYVFMAFDSILETLNDMDYFSVVYRMLGGYVVVCAVYFMFASVLYRYRYEKAKIGLVEYNVNLKELIHADDEPQIVEKKRRTTDDVSAVRAPAPNRTRQANVSRSDLVKRQLEKQQEQKNQEIINNARRLNERMRQRQQEEQQKELDMEAERQRIRARRQQLEREQMQRFRQEQQSMYRQNYQYHTSQNNTAKGGKDA